MLFTVFLARMAGPYTWYGWAVRLY